MTRTLMYTVWICVGVSIVASIHYYMWARLIRDVSLPAPWRQLGGAAVLSVAILVPATMILGRALRIEAAMPVVWAGYVWMGMMFLLLVLIVTSDLARAIGWLVMRLLASGETDEARRLFVTRLIGGGVATGAAGLGLLAIRGGLRAPQLKKVRVSLDRLPAGLDGMTIVQLSDLHAGPTIGRAVIEDLVTRTNALEPDVIAITGDLVDGSVAELRDAVSPLAELRARFGVYFVTGNHEYYSGVHAWQAELERLGIRVLRNERVSVGEGADLIDLAGIDDSTAHQFHSDHGADLEKACEGRDSSRELILLAHQPRAIDEAAALGVGLQLSGHTHGGQIFPFGFLVRLAQPYVAGLYRHDERTQNYVSRGTGYWGPPMRLAAPSELTQIELLCSGGRLA